MTAKRKTRREPEPLCYYASGGGIALSGPYPSEYEARRVFRLTPKAQREQSRTRGTSSPYPHDLVIWPIYSKDDIPG